MFGLRECDRFGAPPKRLLGGVVGFYEALGGLLARYFVRAGGLGRPFLFKWGAAAQKIVGCVLSPRQNPNNAVSRLRALADPSEFSHTVSGYESKCPWDGCGFVPWAVTVDCVSRY